MQSLYRHEYETLLSRYLLPAFAPRPLAAITREDVKRALATWLDTDLSRARIYMVMRLLGTIFTSAIEDGKVATNPAAKPGRLLPPKPPTRDTIDALTKAEVRLLLDTLREGWPMYCPFFLTLARAGLRLGEARRCSGEIWTGTADSSPFAVA